VRAENSAGGDAGTSRSARGAHACARRYPARRDGAGRDDTISHAGGRDADDSVGAGIR
jgi:hypothetical protein